MVIADGFKTGGRVISMTDRREKSLVHPALSQLRAYWEGLRARGDLPTRNDIDPRGIERALEHAFIAERIAPGIARLRLAGMHLNDLMGMEVRGMPLTAFVEPAMRDELQRQIERAFAEPAAVEILLESARGIGRPVLRAKMILLPLRGEDGKVTRVLGGFVAEGEIGRVPRRFRLVSARAEPCPKPVAVELPVAPRAPAVKPALATGFADEPSAYDARVRQDVALQQDPRPKRAHLRLVHSSD